MSKQTMIDHNGIRRHITDFRFENGIAHGVVSGEHVSVAVGNYKYDYKRSNSKVSDRSIAKHALIAEHDRLFGDAKMSSAEVSKLGGARRWRVQNTHVKRLEDGRSIATGVVDGKAVSVMYEGRAISQDGEVKDAKPWLKDVREDLYAAANGTTVSTGTTMADALEREFPTKVNAEFIRRLKSIGLVPAIDSDGNLCVTLGDDSIIIAAMNNETKRFNWLDQREVCLNIDAAYKRKRESLQAYRKEVEAFFTRWIA